MTHVIYHYWNDNIDDILSDSFNPILCAISILRSFNQKINIIVLDRSNKNHDWSKFENLLNFTVVKIKKRFQKNNGYCSDSFARIFDINDLISQFQFDTILFNDVDVFWLTNPLPLYNFEKTINKKYFNCNRNNGVFYFKIKENYSKIFIDMWKHEIEKIIFSEKYRNEFCSKIGFNLNAILHDELVTRKLQNDFPYSYKSIPEFENSLIFTPMNYRKNLHLVRSLSGRNRLAILLSIYEFRKILNDFWGDAFIKKYGNCNYYLLKDHINDDFISNSIVFSGLKKEKITNYGQSKLC